MHALASPLDGQSVASGTVYLDLVQNEKHGPARDQGPGPGPPRPQGLVDQNQDM